MKKSAMLMLCLVLVFALAACAGTVTVTDMKGEVAIPATPQRIVDVAGLTEELLILDMKVIASANTSMFDGVSVPKHLTTLFAERGIEVVGNYSGASSTGDLNLEKIAEIKPDLIIMNIRHEKVYEQLAAIELKLPPSAGVPENVWGEVVDAEYFSLIDADHIFFFSDDGSAGDTGDLAVWKNMKAVKAGNVYFGINEDQYNMAFTAMGKELYLEKLANAILNHGNIE